jgi:hypothetical protein
MSLFMPILGGSIIKTDCHFAKVILQSRTFNREFKSFPSKKQTKIKNNSLFPIHYVCKKITPSNYFIISSCKQNAHS